MKYNFLIIILLIFSCSNNKKREEKAIQAKKAPDPLEQRNHKKETIIIKQDPVIVKQDTVVVKTEKELIKSIQSNPRWQWNCWIQFKKYKSFNV